MNTRLPVSLKDADLEDHRQRFEHEHAADDRQQQLLLDQYRDGSECAAERERTDVAHEYFGRIRVVPKESEARADERAAEDRQLRRLWKVNEQQILGQHAMTRDVGQRGKCGGRNREGPNRQAVEAIGQVDRVRRADQHEDREGHVDPAQIGNQALEEREDHAGVVERRLRVVSQQNQRRSDERGDTNLSEYLVARPQAMVRAPNDLEIVVGESNRTESRGRQHRNPDVDVPQIGPEQRRHQRGGQNQQTSHRRRAGFRRVRRRAFVPDDLADLKLAQLANEPRAEQQADEQRREARRGGPEGDVLNDVQHRDLRVERKKKVVEHQTNSALRRSTTTSVRMPREPFTSTRSPGLTSAAAISAAWLLFSA